MSSRCILALWELYLQFHVDQMFGRCAPPREKTHTQTNKQRSLTRINKVWLTQMTTATLKEHIGIAPRINRLVFDL